ncbi:MAG: hypothetical protein AABW53_00410 [Nanoarchaeota archaeon]
MGILNKLLFWRRDDEFDFDQMADEQLKKGLEDNLGLEPLPDFEEKPLFPGQEPARTAAKGSPYQQTAFQQQAAFPPSTENVERDLELISSKLDTIKAMLASLDQRTANLERAAGVEQQRRERLW